MHDHDALRRAIFQLRRGEKRTHDGGRRRGVAAATATLLLGSVLTGAGLVASVSPASAVPITPVVLQARMVDHIGWDEETAAAMPADGDCARYGTAPSTTSAGTITNPGGSSGTPAAALTDGTTGWIASGSAAYSAHGNSSQTGCGVPELDLSNQSAIGFEPAALSSIETGTVFNLGRMVHRNNPLYTLVNDWFRGWMQIRIFDTVLAYEWRLNETPNDAQPTENPANDDVVDFVNTVADSAFTGPDGNRYTLVVQGFTSPQQGTTCATTLTDPGAAVNRFETVERTSTYGCLYAEIQQVRPLTITKVADAGAPPEGGIPSFAFTATSAAGSPWGTGFSLTPSALGTAGAASVTHDYIVGAPLTITEDPSADPWTFTSLTCVDGVGDPISATAGAAIALSGDLSVTDPAEAPITCTYTNTATPVGDPAGSLVIEKTVTPRTGTPAAGYTGGDDRLFAIDYACTLGGIQNASGTVDASVAAAATVPDLPAGSVCVITDEAQDAAPADFADTAYAWDGFDLESGSVVIPAAASATLTIDNRFVRATSTATPTPTAPTETPAPSSSATPPSALPLTDGSGPASLPLTGSGPVLPLLVVAAGLLLVGALTLGSALRARRRS